LAAHVDVQVPPEQTPLTQLTSVPQGPPRLLRQSPVPPTIAYVWPAGQLHELVVALQVGFDPAATGQVQALLSVPTLEDPPPQAVHGVEPEDCSVGL
jgi:hypothetical protein